MAQAHRLLVIQANDLEPNARRPPHKRPARATQQRPPYGGALPARAARQSRRPDGFTLTDLLVVIAIVAALAGLVLTGLPMATRKSRDIQCRSQASRPQCDRRDR